MDGNGEAPQVRMNHVFVDFENVHELCDGVMELRALDLVVFLGLKQDKLPVALVKQLLSRSASVRIVQLTETGKNALDFVLAYEIGRSSALDPKGYFNIIAKDKGYDPMIKHLQQHGVKVRRFDDSATLVAALQPKQEPVPTGAAVAAAAPVAPATDSALADKLLANLTANPKSRPRKYKSLVKHTQALGGNVEEKSAMDATDRLKKQGKVK
ncbi:MAG TPA: PIN domain-containing protein [Fimbriimonadaceae bacterium]|nr:PIN domain-containing protein [Fimbriimonadaceae bacterium]